jgi:hypothetical protein
MGLLIRSPVHGRFAAPIREPSRLRLLLDHFSRIEDKRRPEDVAHKLNEILLVCVCATIADCDSFEAISDWERLTLPSCSVSWRSTGGSPRGAGSTS